MYNKKMCIGKPHNIESGTPWVSGVHRGDLTASTADIFGGLLISNMAIKLKRNTKIFRTSDLLVMYELQQMVFILT